MDPVVAEALERARALMTEGEYDAAAIQFERAEQFAGADKKSAILSEMSQCYFKSHKFEECIAAASQAIRADPGNGNALYRRSKAKDRQHDLEGAIADAEAARKIPDTRAKADAWFRVLKTKRDKAKEGGAQLPEKRKKRPRPKAAARASVQTGPQMSISIQYSNQINRPLVEQFLDDSRNVESMLGHNTTYRPTILDLEHKPLLLHEEGPLGRVDWIDPEGYGVPQDASSMPPPPGKKDLQLLADRDERALRDDDLPQEVQDALAKKRKLEEPTEAFAREAFGLQLPQLVTNVLTEKNNAVVGFHAAEKNLHREEATDMSPEDLTERVERTFADAKEAPVHPKNRDLKPARILPIVPDSVLWANKYQQIIFDELPPKEARENDLLLKSVPTPRVTCFGYFSAPQAGEPDGTYRLSQNYIWDNRGGFTRSAQIEEGEAMLWSYPKAGADKGAADEPEAIGFSFVPTMMRLKKQKAARLDINIDLQSLSVVHREPSQQEEHEERKKMRPVLGEEEEEEEESTSRQDESVASSSRVKLPEESGSPTSEQTPKSPSGASGSEPLPLMNTDEG